MAPNTQILELMQSTIFSYGIDTLDYSHPRKNVAYQACEDNHRYKAFDNFFRKITVSIYGYFKKIIIVY